LIRILSFTIPIPWVVAIFLGKKNKSSLQGGEELRKAVLFLENHLPIALGNVRNV